MSTAKGGKQIRGNDAARFASKTRRAENGCIEWTGALTTSGYGKFMVGPAGGQTTWLAHRWAYARRFGRLGEAPDLLRHTCDNPRCVNVKHLEPGTQLENVHDAIERGRRVVSLTPELVRHFRTVRASGASIRAEASRLGVKYMTAYQAAIGNTWRHIA